MKTKKLTALVVSIIVISTLMIACSNKSKNDNESDERAETISATTISTESTKSKESIEILTESESTDSGDESISGLSSGKLGDEFDFSQESNSIGENSTVGESTTKPEWEDWQNVSVDKKVNILNLSDNSVADFRVAMPDEYKKDGDNYYVTTNTGMVLFSKSGANITSDRDALERRIDEFVKETINHFKLDVDVEFDSITITDEFVNGIESKCFTFTSSDVLVLGYIPVYDEYSGTTFVSFDKNGSDSLRMLEKILVTGQHTAL